MIKVVIFDLDGLLVDSTPLQQVASQKFIEGFGKPRFAPRSGREGMRIKDIVEEYKHVYDLPGSSEDLYKKRQQIFHKLVKETLSLFPGVYEALDKVKKRKLRISMATSGDRDYVKLVFQKFPRFYDYFETVVTGDDVMRGKPHPDIFLKTAETLGVKPNECVVLEDSFNGVLAAKKAGMSVIAIPNKRYSGADYSQADKVFESLEECTLNL